MGKPTENTKVSENTAEEGFNVGDRLEEVLSPLTYQGRGGGNPDAPKNIGILGADGEEEMFEPKDPLGILDTITGGPMARGKRGGAYGK